jgi:3-oxoacyl-[acyl-carrier protein] reductase
MEKRIAFVTGGSRGIGASIVKKLCDDDVHVVFTYRESADAAHNLANEIRAGGGVAQAIRADSESAAEIREAVERAASITGTISVVVNNAGIQLSGEVFDYSERDLDRSIAINVKAAFVTIQAALRFMGKGGRIINIGSVSSDYMPSPGHSVYAMTKGAIASLTRGLVHELGPRGITINNVQPGRIDTEMLRGAIGDEAELVRNMLPVGRFGTGDEVAAMVAYLVRPEAGYITGAQIHVDGGISA